MADNWKYITCDIVAVSDYALLVRFDDGHQEWLPKSQVSPEDLPALKKGDKEVEFAVTEWIAKQKGWL